MKPGRSSSPRATPACGAVAALLALAALAACAPSVDAEQARLCRATLPALNPSAGAIEVFREGPAPQPRTLRVDYRVALPDRPNRDRFALCRFASEGLSRGRADLVALANEDGPVPDASFYLLKRFYLDSPEGVAGTPPAPRIEAGVADIPAPLAYGLQQILVGAPRTAIYGLLAAACALVFGLVRRFNLAFGELAAIGAAAAGISALLSSLIGWTPLAGLAGALLAAISAGILHGTVAGTLSVTRIAGPSGRPALIATLGMSLALMEYLRLVQGTVTPWLPPLWSQSLTLARAGDFAVGTSPVSLATSGIGLGTALALVLLMRRSRYGRAWRAYADDPLAATLFGIDGRRLLAVTLGLSGALAGLAGALVVLQFGGLGYAGGFQLGLKALIAAILGGVSSVGGGLIGGLAIGLFETIWSAYLPIDARDIALYAMLAAVLVARPGGLFGLAQDTPRPV